MFENKQSYNTILGICLLQIAYYPNIAYLPSQTNLPDWSNGQIACQLNGQLHSHMISQLMVSQMSTDDRQSVVGHMISQSDGQSDSQVSPP